MACNGRVELPEGKLLCTEQLLSDVSLPECSGGKLEALVSKLTSIAVFDSIPSATIAAWLTRLYQE